MLLMHLGIKFTQIICEKEDDIEIITNEKRRIFVQQTSKDDFRRPFAQLNDKVVKSVVNFYRHYLKYSSIQEFWFVSDCGIRGMGSNTTMMFNEIFKNHTTLRTKVSKQLGKSIADDVFRDFMRTIEAKIIDFDRVRTEIITRLNSRYKHLTIEQVQEIHHKVHQRAKNLCTKGDTSREEFDKAFEPHFPRRKNDIATLPRSITKEQLDLEINSMTKAFEPQLKDLDVLVTGCGFTLLNKDHFKNHKSPDNSFELWKRGFPFDLASIKLGLQYTRPVVYEIIQQLNSASRLLVLAEMGYGKTTILMELICHYHGLGFTTLYNLDGSEIKNIDQIVTILEHLLKEEREIFLAIDNVHDERTVPIFRLMECLEPYVNSKRVKVIMAARIPEFNFFVEENLNKVDESNRIPLLKFQTKRNAIFQLGHLEPIPIMSSCKQ